MAGEDCEEHETMAFAKMRLEVDGRQDGRKFVETRRQDCSVGTIFGLLTLELCPWSEKLCYNIRSQG